MNSYILIAFLTITSLCLVLNSETIDAAQINFPTLTIVASGNEQIILTAVNGIRHYTFNKDYDMTAWFCINTATVTDAEEIAFNKNTITIKGKGYCAFKTKKK